MPERPNLQPDARLLRLVVDDELSAGERERASTLLQGVGAEANVARQMVQDERRMQEAVGRVMASDSAPSALRASITQMLATTGAAGLEASGIESEVAGRIARGGVATSSRRHATLARLFAAPHRANLAAVAAVLALILGAVLFGIYGRTIDDVPPPRTIDVVANVAQYVDGEHTQCTASIEHIRQESTWLTRREAELGMSNLLGAPVQAFDLSSLGYEFVGAGGSHVPVETQPSGHLIYRKTINGRPGPMVSVFMAPVRGCCRSICASMQPGEWQVAKASCKRRVLYSTDGRVVYFLVCCDERDQSKVAETISLAQAANRR